MLQRGGDWRSLLGWVGWCIGVVSGLMAIYDFGAGRGWWSALPEIAIPILRALWDGPSTLFAYMSPVWGGMILGLALWVPVPAGRAPARAVWAMFGGWLLLMLTAFGVTIGLVALYDGRPLPALPVRPFKDWLISFAVSAAIWAYLPTSFLRHRIRGSKKGLGESGDSGGGLD